jgi:hypothetical protein
MLILVGFMLRVVYFNDPNSPEMAATPSIYVAFSFCHSFSNFDFFQQPTAESQFGQQQPIRDALISMIECDVLSVSVVIT